MSPNSLRRVVTKHRTFFRVALFGGIAFLTAWGTFTSYSARIESAGDSKPSNPAAAVAASKRADAQQRVNLDKDYGKLQLSFEANNGQTDPAVKYFARGSGYNVFFTNSEAVLVLSGASAKATDANGDDENASGNVEPLSNRMAFEKARRSAAALSIEPPTVVRMRLEGANTTSGAVRGDDELPGKVNYFFGNDPSKWNTNVSTYSKVTYNKVYPGIDLVYYGNRQQLEYDLVVAPGADPNLIQLAIDGTNGLSIDPKGNLVLKTKAGDIQQLKPSVFQEINGARKEIKGSYVLKAGNKVGFRIEPYDRGRPLVIDPILRFLSFVNGSGEGIAMTTDAAGNTYFTGVVFDANLNATPGAFQILTGGLSDCFVTKLNSTGSAVSYTTYLGGSGDEYGNGVSIDSAGNALIAGSTSGTFPTTPGAYQTVRQGLSDGFITKLNAAGNALIFSTLFGGNGIDEVDNTVFEPSGDFYFSGLGESSNLQTTPGAFRTTYSGGEDGFAAKMNATGTAITYLTYIGGGGFDYPTDMAADSAGNVYLAGQTTSLNFPTQNAIQSSLGGPNRGVFKSSSGGSTWALSSVGLQGTYVYSLAINPTTPSTIYIGTDGGVYKSINSGASWANTGVMPIRYTRQLLIDPTSTNTIYAATDSGVFKTTNGGTTWTPSSNGLIQPNMSAEVRGLALAPSAPNTIYAAGLGGVFKTTDGGANWTAINVGLPSTSNANTNAIVVDPQAPNTAYVSIAATSRVYKTTNGGASWLASSTGLPNSIVNALAINPTTPGTLFAATNAGVYRSTNNGGTWAAVNTGLALPRSDGGTTSNPIIFGLTLDPSNPNTIYAAAGNAAAPDGSFFTFAAVFKSTDAGNNWTAQTNGFNNAFTAFSSIAVDPTNPSIVYTVSFGDADAFVLKLNDTGTSAVFSTYLGGDRVDGAGSVALDGANNVYLSGVARAGFPTTPGAFQTTMKGLSDHFVAKVNSAGTSLAYSTYLGGTDVEIILGGLVVDSSGNAYVEAATFSADFPVTPGAFQGTIGNPGVRNQDCFVTKLNPAGNALVYSSFLGAGGNDFVNGFLGSRIALDASNNLYVLGVSNSTNLYATFFINMGFTTGTTFVAKIDGTVPTYSVTGRITTSGNVGIAGVFVDATNAQGFVSGGQTDAQGYYSIINLPAGNYTITPLRDTNVGQHYYYSPPSVTFNGLNSNQTANFTGTQVFDIFGQISHATLPVGIFDVTVNLTGAANASVVSDAQGFFTFRDLAPGNYTVTPSKPGFTFTPVNRVFSPLTTDQFVSFTTTSGSFFTVSGRVATPGNVGIANASVTMLLTSIQGFLPTSVLTDANGNYSFPNLQGGGNYTFLATSPLQTFTPANPTFPNLNANQTLNFTSGPVTGLIGRIAFISDNGTVNLSVMNADTTSEINLVDTDPGGCSSDESAPAWSPDGSRIAFSRCDTIFEDLYTIKPDGTDLTRITNQPLHDLFPSWSPNGTKITYTYGECSGTDVLVPEIFATDLTGNATNLTNNGILDAYSDWSPNGSRIVFSRANTASCSSAESDAADLFTMNSTGGNEVQITNTAQGDFGAKYSPDGSKIAFGRQDFSQAGLFSSGIYIVNADGTNEVRVTPSTVFAFGPTWSPDGTKLAFDAIPVAGIGSSQIFVVNADGTGLAQLTEGTTLRESPAWQHYSISGHVTGNTDGPLTMVLAGTLTRVTQTDANGDYVFGNLTPFGNYSVTPVSTAFTLNPVKRDVNNLIGNAIADFTVTPPLPAPTPPLSDDFGGAQRDPTRWNLGTQTQPLGAYDPLVTAVQVNGQLVITPRTNQTGLHYNGYVSVNSFDFNNATATVEVSQVAINGADTIFAIGSDLDNFTRFVVSTDGAVPDMYNPRQAKRLGPTVAQLIFQVRIGGQLTSVSIPYNQTAHRFFRFRHDPTDNSIVFETSPDNKNFTEQHRVVLSRSVSALTAELSAGTSTATNPGSAVFNSFQLVTNTFQFGTPVVNTADFGIGEGGLRATLTITRIGSSANAATVEYITRDTAGLTNCNVFNGIASSRCDYGTTLGSVRFEAGQTTKTITVPIVDDGFAEGPETFTVAVRNSTGAGIGAPSRAIVTITDNDPATGPNPIDQTTFFVRQQYVDFLNREPDPAGAAGWESVINNCPAGDITCDRIHVSSAFFRSAEFQGRGYFIYRFYPVAFGRKPEYSEFIPDLAKVSGFLSDQQLEAAKLAFIAEFMSRDAFISKFDHLDNTQYVDTLLATAGITHIARDFWIAALGNGTRTRAQVLREIAESNEVYNKYYNQAFVVMQYFGYLRRDPDALYLNWIAVLDANPNDFRGMVNGFSNSLEYRFRFGP